MIDCAEGVQLLDPDFSRTAVEVYRGAVEAAFINFKTTNALLYVSGREDPSWVPRWDVPMPLSQPCSIREAYLLEASWRFTT